MSARDPDTMRLRLLVPLVALPALALPAGAAAAAPSYPSITKVSPLKLGVGDTLTIKGKQFRSGKAKNTVVFQRAGGRAVFVKAGSGSVKKLSVVIPAKLLTQMKQKAGTPVATRFRVRVLAKRLGKRFTTLKASPMIGPVGTQPKAAAPADCDGDQVPNTKDLDDDNDLLSDAVEAEAGTDACKPDTDEDGMSDGWEHESALDYNGRALPSPKKRPYPNALDPADAGKDSDGDGLTNLTEYTLWASYGGKVLPLSFSGGDPATGGKKQPAADQKWFDRDQNGYLSDNERDGDGDGIPNQDEGLDALPPKVAIVGFLNQAYIDDAAVHAVVDQVPLYGALEYTHKVAGTSATDNDSDGDSVSDGADDQDGDGHPNVEELQADVADYFEKHAAGEADEVIAKEAEHRSINACVPDLDARMCVLGDGDIDKDTIPNRQDEDDDGDLLADLLELSPRVKLNPYKADSDGDGAEDGFEYSSAIDFNNAYDLQAESQAFPYPHPYKLPYPNALDPEDAGIDFDGDGLPLLAEYRAWDKTGRLDRTSHRADIKPTGDLGLFYSDGKRRSAPGVPGEGVDDDERDADKDKLTNYVEYNGPLSGPAWWTSYVANNKCSDQYTETPYPVVFAGMDFTDRDTDGDGVLDGEDDIDHDGLNNLDESTRPGFGTGTPKLWCQLYVSTGPAAPGAMTGGKAGSDPSARRNPFNPCKPYNSLTCHKHAPFDYYPYGGDYTEDWVGADPPA